MLKVETVRADHMDLRNAMFKAHDRLALAGLMDEVVEFVGRADALLRIVEQDLLPSSSEDFLGQAYRLQVRAWMRVAGLVGGA